MGCAQCERVNVDEKRFAPYIVHPLAPVSFDAQIPKKGDQRQMEAWQRIGTYAAGLALDSAGVKGDQEILGRMDMIVAAGGGERDVPVDLAILQAYIKGNASPAFLNERLMNDLRPTLFLAQLSNLLAGNIAIVHGVSGTSRTFMGEEAASIDAARIALARIESGQSDIALVGAAHNGERTDLLILYEFGDFNLKDKFEPVWARDNTAALRWDRPAFSGDRIQGACRGPRRQALRKLTNVVTDLAQRKQPGAVTKSLETLWSKLGSRRRQCADHRRDRCRAGDVGRKGVPARAPWRCGARHRNLVRPHAGDPVSTGARAGGAFALARRAVSAQRPDRVGG